MNDVCREENRFFIDLSGGRVFCRSCGTMCKSLELSEFVLFWCSSHACENWAEVRHYPDGSWNVFGVVELWQEDSISRIMTTLLMSIKAKPAAESPESPIP